MYGAWSDEWRDFQVVEARTNTPSMIEALEAIAVFYGKQGGNTAEARKSLRQVSAAPGTSLSSCVGVIHGGLCCACLPVCL